MSRQHLSPSFLICGVLLLMVGLSAMLPGAARAQQDPVPAPSPRPAIQFTEQSSGGGSSAPDHSAIPGHIGGTVIDVVSSAPVPGLPVRIGDNVVFTDQDGNYGIWVSPGTYLVNVAPAPEQGTVVDGPAAVVVEPETSVIQHLRVALPVPDVKAAESPVEAPVEAPRRLPRTNDPSDVTWVWVSFGILLIGAGIGLGMLPAGRRALATSAAGIAHLSNQALLQKLLSERPSRSTKDDALLRELLESQE
ncbi:carboxypeptidase regulatory-like domain-containing protein [Roseiflexus castenholzii]|uniref:carboxypeptidase regulatory-like domain-containing protein n=1 Tax=Roseiflexus castenholzii TaxID=120962 RepID=UPI0023540D5B